MNKLILLFVSLFFTSTLSAQYTTIIPKMKKKDLLIVIDDSPSMQMHWDTLNTNFINFVENNYENVDLRILAITSSFSTNAPNFYSSNKKTDTVENALRPLLKAINLGVGDPDEKFFSSILDALTQSNDFIRSDAKFDILVVTDADDQSRISNIDFLVQLKKIKPLSDIKFSTIVPLSQACNREDTQTKFINFVNITELTNGVMFDLCLL